MSKGICLRALSCFCFLSVTLIPAAGAASVPADFYDGFQPQSVQHVQMLVLSEYFEATPKELNQAAQKLDTTDEMTVALFLSRESGKRLKTVLKHRAAGDSWWEMAQDLNVHPGWLLQDNLLHLRNVGVKGLAGMKPEQRRPMEDARFQDLVCAHVTGRYFETPPSRVLQVHEQGKTFREIQYSLYHADAGGHAASHPGNTDVDLVKVHSTSTPKPVAQDADKVLRHRAGQRPHFE